ncbi:circadian clock KaiB family protein [Dehalogenimonas etheniformans]|uniref:Circadian clock protein KaiB n=1 Tax=Dehalogenimonas etheniformans TaxID=1536648 RepID=A0A2P5P4X0_9CHLR|nr:circadian clock KaiB family protein [Dehalogenimonas etheniformans]PPD57335.1 circadian clock protein KaiB [Dehalogenimonas etheniformans]QNT77053.1 circadian clock KaiB family protein [Dehalogenimonas etheniformans]
MEKVKGPPYGDTEPAEEWKLRLFVTDWNPRCIVAYRNLKKICQEDLENKCSIEVIDILEQPDIARQEQIVAIPALKKILPKPSRILVGDFSKKEKVLKALDVERWLHG